MRKRNILIAAAAVVILGVVGAQFLPGSADAATMTVYKSPACGCCGEWIAYMRRNGFSVRVEEVEDVWPVKSRLGVDEALWSCHTATLGNYVIEGHVTMAAIRKLLDERPDVRGIALPGMPQGSPGMSGTKDGPWVTYTISESAPQVFMTE